jgi:hypothetical protein
MNDAPETRPVRAKFGRTTILCLAVVLLLLGYGLSTGPVISIFGTPKPVQIFYAPLEFLGDICPPVEQFFDWYCDQVWGAKQ